MLNASEPKSYKQIGNAIPPVMMWYVAHALQEAILCTDKRDETIHSQIHQLNFVEVKKEYPSAIVQNVPVEVGNNLNVDKKKNVLISIVKSDNIDQYLDRSAKVYYTGKKFPSTVALNKLYYFMPYFKGKGVRDLYFIKIARVGTKKEVHPECPDNDFRLVFEIQYMGQLFNDYQLVHLDIWRTFKDTTIEDLFKLTDINKKVCFV